MDILSGGDFTVQNKTKIKNDEIAFGDLYQS